jgi:hypothetical protein
MIGLWMNLSAVSVSGLLIVSEFFPHPMFADSAEQWKQGKPRSEFGKNATDESAFSGLH